MGWLTVETVALAVSCLAMLPQRALAGAVGKLDLRGQRLVFLGDSITDGFSYPLLFKQALEEAGVPAPLIINAGIGGDTAAGMQKRLDRDVFPHKPTLVTLSAGINDVLRNVKPADYETSVTDIAAQLKARNVPLLVLTTSVLGARNAEADRKLAEFNGALRRLAQREGYRLADVNALMQAARAAGTEVMEEDHVHPNYQGHRVMARAVLDALGYADVPVPKELKVAPLPGIVREWKVRAVQGKKEPPAEEPAADWTAYSLPEKEPIANWWQDQERRRGLAMSLDRVLGKADRYRATAEFSTDKAKAACVNTGGLLQRVWLNGTLIYKATDEWRGWHPGRERIQADLVAGKNVITIETGPQFFLSITETNDW
ncbi:MAG: SGNH/GDSL hydrolase family protein [Planctomycetota bacterium]|nr:SGNH/GDSL hydrolase family protein [Planctomycetota bacterium]